MIERGGRDDGQKAIVTGGGSGIGRVTCQRMAEVGAKVAALDINGDIALSVAAEIDGWTQRSLQQCRVGCFSRLEEYDPLEGDRILRVNLTGVFAGFRAAIAHIKAGGGSHCGHGIDQRYEASRR